MSTYRLSSDAQSDITEIWLYVCSQAESEKRADAILERLYGAFEALAQNPFLGRREPEPARDVWAYPVGKYLVVYRIEDDSVRIARISGGAQDVLRGL